MTGKNNLLSDPLRLLGAAVAGLALLSGARRLLHEFQRSPLPALQGGQGTALITGASSGFGAEFARQLARQGYNLVLVARRLERLEDLAVELTSRYGIQVEALPADLSTPEGIEKVASRIADLPDLTLLVNNAGFGTVGRFHKVSPQSQADMLSVHTTATLRLCQAALPGMVARGGGAVINMASVAAFLPLLGNATYGATKAYNLSFSQALAAELHGSGVRVQALCPGFTYTEMHSTSEYAGFRHSAYPDFLWLKAPFVVRESLKDLQKNIVVSIPGWQYKLVAWVAGSPLIAPWLQWVANAFLRTRR